MNLNVFFLLLMDFYDGILIMLLTNVGVPPESEKKETGDNEKVKANADKDKESEDDLELVRDCQKESGDQSMEDLGWEGGVRIHLEQRQKPGVKHF